MIGFAQFQDDLETIRRALYAGQISAAKVDAQRALERVLSFARTLENLDVHELPEKPQGAPPHVHDHHYGKCECGHVDPGAY